MAEFSSLQSRFDRLSLLWKPIRLKRLFHLKLKHARDYCFDCMRQTFAIGFGFLSTLYLLVQVARATEPAEDFDATTEPVGQSYSGFLHNRFVTPVNQVLTAAGWQVELPAIRPEALALSPDHSLLVTSGQVHQMLVIGVQTGKILQQVPFPPDQSPAAAPLAAGILHPDENAHLSFTGITFRQTVRVFTWLI